MKVFGISDTHLSSVTPKPMEIFGLNWTNHFERIKQSWYELVGEEDIVLIPGDISWAMKLQDAIPDLQLLGDCPGKKVILRGNHDYWWDSIAKVRKVLPQNMFALQNDSLRVNNLLVCGSRGWVCPGAQSFKAEDEKIYAREVMRLDLSLRSLKPKESDTVVVLMHYPPFNERREPSGFVRMLEEHRADIVLYGHLHGKSCAYAYEGVLNGVEYHLVSCDHLDFSPRLIMEL